MNLGLYEIMDRISTVQVLVDDSISNHKESDYFLKQILVEVQQCYVLMCVAISALLMS